MEKLIIDVGRQLDGYTFRLHPQSKVEIQERFTDRLRPAVPGKK